MSGLDFWTSSIGRFVLVETPVVECMLQESLEVSIHVVVCAFPRCQSCSGRSIRPGIVDAEAVQQTRRIRERMRVREGGMDVVTVATR